MVKPSKTRAARWPAVAKQNPPPELKLAEAYEIGRIATEQFSGTSMPKVIREQGLSLTRVTFRRCMAVFRVLNELKQDPQNTPLNFATARQLDGLPRKYQQTLLSEVAAGLAAKRLEFRIREIRRELPPPKNNAPRRLGFELALRHLEPFENGLYDLVADLPEAKQLDAETRRELAGRATRLASQLGRVVKALESAQKRSKSGKAAAKAAPKPAAKKKTAGKAPAKPAKGKKTSGKAAPKPAAKPRAGKKKSKATRSGR